MYLELPSKLKDLSGCSHHNQNLTSELSESLLVDYCSSCSKKTDCEIKSKLERLILGINFQHSYLVVLEEMIDATHGDFYVEEELIEREDGLIETSDGLVFAPYNGPYLFLTCIGYQSQQRSLPGLKSKYLDFVYPLLEQYSTLNSIDNA